MKEKIVLGKVEEKLLFICLYLIRGIVGYYVKVGELYCFVVYYTGYDNKVLKVFVKKMIYIFMNLFLIKIFVLLVGNLFFNINFRYFINCCYVFL